MNRLELATGLVRTATAAVQLKQRQLRPHLHRVFTKAVHQKETLATERDVQNALIPMFKRQIKKMVDRLAGLDGKVFEELVKKGGPGSGNFGHEGRPGEVGGSGEDESGGGAQVRQIDTPEFKKWFGNSKVVDEKGEPLVVYHGTVKEFDEFSPNHQGTGIVGMGFYFDRKVNIPNRYAGEEEGSRVIPVYLSIKNPAEVLDQMDVELAYAKENPEYKNLPFVDRQKLLQSALIKSGFDGAHWEGIWVAFFPTQIKSTTGNRGTFDPNDPDITKSVSNKPVSLVRRIFDPKKATKELVDRLLPILAIRMAEAARNQMLSMGIDVRRRRKSKKGGPGSGNFGHEGRPGEVGGSGEGTVGVGVGLATESGGLRHSAQLYSQVLIDGHKVVYMSRAYIHGEDLNEAYVNSGATEEHGNAARVLVGAIRDAPEEDLTMYRAITFRDAPGSPDANSFRSSLESAKVGDLVNLDRILSFSEDQAQAAYYGDQRKGVTNYQIVITGQSRSIATDELTGMGHKERITQGRFEVVSIHDGTTRVKLPPEWLGSTKYNKTIGLRQVGVF